MRLSKLYFIKPLLFIFILIAICYSLDFFLVKGTLLKKNVWNEQINGKINADVIISGSSRALVHFNCNILRENTNGLSFFNIGKNGTSFDLQLAIFKTYLKYNKKPKILIQQVDHYLCITKGISNIYEPYQYVPYLNNPELYNILKYKDPIFAKFKYIPLFAFSYFHTNLVPMSLKGWIEYMFGKFVDDDLEILKNSGYWAYNTIWDGKFDEYKKNNPNGITSITTDYAVNQIKEFINICITNNIKIILVYAPEYHQLTDMRLNHNEIISIYNNLSHTNKIPFWNYCYSPITYKKEYFYNGNHLTVAGADIFSKELSKRLNEYISSSP